MPTKKAIRAGLETLTTEAAAFLKKYPTSINASFPSGWISQIGPLKQRWPYLTDGDARTVACAIQLCDVNRFYLRTFDVSLTAGTMWEWHVSLPVIAVIETIVHGVAKKENWGKKLKFHPCIDLLHTKGVIDTKFQVELHDLRDYRNEIHLYLKNKVEMHDGKPARYEQAVQALERLEADLKKFYKIP